jgi:hypothetical protein
MMRKEIGKRYLLHKVFVTKADEGLVIDSGWRQRKWGMAA